MIDCKNPKSYHVTMLTTIETFWNNHFYRFGRPILRIGDGRSYDMAWRFHPWNAKHTAFYKDCRCFELTHGPNCIYSVVEIGDYHTSTNSHKKKNKLKDDLSTDTWDVTDDLVPQKARRPSSFQ